jgi:hypothetical protein
LAVEEVLEGTIGFLDFPKLRGMLNNCLNLAFIMHHTPSLQKPLNIGCVETGNFLNKKSATPS